ncbi:MAG: flagella basal body P-ring formation protein FlgA [Deltaproteobacteria bacterium]|nr:flagella basal body P-ring formation protein FlgA [Deltaproteobacteria bacterium]
MKSFILTLTLALVLPATVSAKHRSDAQSAIDAITAEVESRLPDGLSLESVSPSQSMNLPRGAELSLQWRGTIRAGKSSAFVVIRKDDKILSKGWVRMEIVETNPPIERGTEVRVVVKSGAVSITTTGSLERNARVGDFASVRLDGQNTRITGKLIDGNTLQVGGAP